MPKSLSTAPIDINTASLEELMRLPGVGPSLARRITAARPFKSVRDFVLVDGIGPKLYATLLPLITVTAERKKPRRAVDKGAREVELAVEDAPIASAPPITPEVPETEAVPAEAPAAPPVESPSISLEAARRALIQAIPTGAAEPAPAQTLEAPAGLPSLPFEPAGVDAPIILAMVAPPREAPAGIPALRPEIPPAEPLAARTEETVIAAPMEEPSGIATRLHLEAEAKTAPAEETPKLGAGRPDRFAELEADVEPEITVWTPVETEAPAAPPELPREKPAMPTRVGTAPEARPAPAAKPVGKTKSQVAIPLKGAGTYPVRSGLYSGNLRRRYSMPVNTRLRIALGVFYGIIGVALIGLTYLVIVYVRAAGPKATPAAATTPASAAASVTSAIAFTATSTRPAFTATPTASATVTATLTPSPTITLTPTIAPTSPAGAGPLIFIETFNAAPYAWRGIGSIDFSNTSVQDGQMIFTTSRPYLAFWPGNREYLGDIYYQAVTRVGECKAADHYGLQVRAMDAANFYLFGIQCDGKVRIQVREQWNYRALVADQPASPAIKTGSGAVNVLAVRAFGNEFRFFVNGELLNTFTDSTFRDGKIGIYGRAAETSTLMVGFDDVIVWQAVP